MTSSPRLSSPSSTQTSSKPFNEILLSELDAKLNDYDIHEILEEFALSVDQLQKEDLYEDGRLPNIGGIGDIDTALELLPRDIMFLKTLYREDYAKDAEEEVERKANSNLLMDSSSPFFDFLREIDSRSPEDQRLSSRNSLLNLIKSNLPSLTSSDTRNEMPESVTVKEELSTHIKTEKTVEKKPTSDDAPVRQQRRKSKKPPVEADNEVPLEDLPPPAKKTKRKYVWRTPRVDKKTGEMVGGPGASGASAAPAPAELTETLHVPKVPTIDESIEKLLSSVSCMLGYWLSRIKDVAKRAAIASGSAGSGGTGSGNHAQPLEVVRAVSLELEKRGLPVLRHSDKVEAVNLCIKGKNSSKVIGGSSLSVSRVASSVANEYLNSFSDSAESFNLLLLTAKKDATDRSKKKWEALLCNTKKVNLEDIPAFMDRIPNPFDRFGPNADAWHWLGQPSPTSVATLGFHPRQPDDVFSFLRVSFPSLNRSGRDRKENDTLGILDNEGGHVLASLKKYAAAASNAAIRDYGNALGIWSPSSHLAIDRVLDTLAAFNSCILVDRATVPLDPDYSAGITAGDGEWDVDEHELQRLRSVVHRAVLNASVIYHMAQKTRKFKSEDTIGDPIKTEIAGGANIPSAPSISSSATKKKSQNDSLQEFWGPVLIVCDEKDLSAWEQGIRPLCSAAGLQLLPYKGTVTERDHLLAYLNLSRVNPTTIGHVPLTVHVNLSSPGSGANLYTERGHCHVVLMSTELFLLDQAIFQDILWELQIWDQPFGRFIHPRQRSPLTVSTTATNSGKGGGKSKLDNGSKKLFQQHYQCYQQMLSMAGMTKARIFSCDTLRCSSNSSLETLSRLSTLEDISNSSGKNRSGDFGPLHPPDIVETVFAVFPSAMGLTKFYNNMNMSSGKASLVDTEAEHYLLSNSLFSLYGPGYTALDDNTMLELQKIATAFTIICEDQVEHSIRAAQTLYNSSISSTTGGDNPPTDSSEKDESEVQKSYAQIYDILPHLEWVGLTLSLEISGVSAPPHEHLDTLLLEKTDVEEASKSWLPNLVASLVETGQCKVCFLGRGLESFGSTSSGPLMMQVDSKNESNDNGETVPMDIEEPVQDEAEDEKQEEDAICTVDGSNTILSKADVNERPSLDGASETVEQQRSLGSSDLSPVNEVSMAESIDNAESNKGPSSYPADDVLDEDMAEGDQLEESHDVHASHSKVDPVIPKVAEAKMLSYEEEVASTTIVFEATSSNKAVKDPNLKIPSEVPVIETIVAYDTTKDLGDSLLLKQKKAVPETLASDKEDNDLEDLDEEEGGAPNPTAVTGNVADLAPVKKKRAKRRSKEEMDEARRQKLQRQEEKKALLELKKKRKTAEDVEPVIVEKAVPIMAEVEGLPASSSASVKLPGAYELERSKHLVKKLGTGGLHIWAVNIVFYGRSKFLGYFNSYEGAMKAYDTAHCIRTIMLSNVTSQVRFKGKIGRDIKLSDGSFISKDYYKEMDDDWVIEEIMVMCIPQVVTGCSLSSWANATCPPGANYPPAFAVLRGLNGFYARLTHFRCVLGKASAGVEALVSELGDADKGANGLVFDYGDTRSGEDDEDDDDDDDDEKYGLGMCPSIHIGFHTSIARKHALIEWDFEQQIYSIQCLCPGGIWVEGVLKHTDDGPVALRHRSVVQIGYRIFFFLLPTQPINKLNMHPMSHNQNIANALLQTLKYRSLISNYSTQQDNAEDLSDTVVMGEMADILEKTDAIVLGGVFPGVDIALKDR
eukprot:gene29535-38650_t